jgi:type IV pilus assembly protein PilV
MTSSEKQPTQDGFTLIEVMMALAIMVVGAVGILAMQRAATRANSEAREFTTATQITRNWVEIARRDALNWNQTGIGGVAGTQYLRNVPIAAGAPGAWFTPAAAVTETTSYGYNGLPAVGAPHYCVNMRLRWTLQPEAIRTEVRTWWHRRTASMDNAYGDRQLYANCGVGSEGAITGEIYTTYRIRAVQAATVVRWTQVP